MNSEKMIFEVVANSMSKTKGDLSEHLLEQGFFEDGDMPRSLKGRQHELSSGNAIDLIDVFNKQNPE